MPDSHKKRAVIVGSGPNGLSAAILLARAGYHVEVHEANAEIGGGARTAELTLPGFRHDVCSAIHPMAVSSPCFEQFPLAAYGLEWIHPDAPLAHPLDDGTAVMLERSVDETARGLGIDGAAWRRLFEPFVEEWPQLREDILSPLLGIPKHPFLMARFGRKALRSVTGLAASEFRGHRARALFAGIGAHAVMPLEQAPSAAMGLALGIAAHAVGWPMARGGSGNIAEALGGYLQSLGGEILLESRVDTLPDADVVMCDVTPRQLLHLGGDRFPLSFRKSLASYRYGPGVFKMDWALDGPIPWRARECARAATVHVGGTIEEIAQWESGFHGRPFVLVAQQSLFDDTRAPEGQHTAWAYCHVPNGSADDMSGAIEEQIERFAPGFRERVLARHRMGPAELERRNANLVGGDIGGGAISIEQLIFRPTRRLYGTPARGVYICSSSTPPGGAVHGMCGFNAVHSFLSL